MAIFAFIIKNKPPNNVRFFHEKNFQTIWNQIR